MSLNLFNVNIYYNLVDFNTLFTSIKSTLEVNLFISLENIPHYFYLPFNNISAKDSTLLYTSENILNKNEFNQVNAGFFELSNYYRFLNTSNPFVKIYYKPCNIKAPWVDKHPIMLKWVTRELPLGDNSRAPY